MATSPGIWAPIATKLMKQVIRKASTVVKPWLENLPKPAGAKLQPALARNAPRAIHPLARVRQPTGARWYSTHRAAINATIRRLMSTAPTHASKVDRAAFPKSRTATAVSQLTSRAPFASTLRPNLTGGAFPRTAGGYSLGGGKAGARYFSHSPAAPAQVISNVNGAVRAFFLSGQKAQFDGLNQRGEKKYRVVTNLQDEASQRFHGVPMAAPGSYIDFHVSPKVTALSPRGATFPFVNSATEQSVPNLNTDGFLDILSVDFARALKELTTILSDLKKLAALGDLQITMESKSTLRVRFPGCDADMVERLCDEVGVQQGIIHQDMDFDASFGGQLALRYPFCPTSEHTLSSPGGSLRSQTGHELLDAEDFEELEETNPWATEGYESMEDSDDDAAAYYSRAEHPKSSGHDLEAIYQFISECDARR